MGIKRYGVAEYPVAFSPLEPDLMLWSGKGHLHGCFLESGQHFHIPIEVPEIKYFLIHPHQSLVFLPSNDGVGSYDYELQLKVNSYKKDDGFKDGINDLRAITIDPLGQLLAISNPYDGIYIWDIHTNEVIRNFKVKKEIFNYSYSMCFSPDSRILAICCEKYIGFWDTSSWQEIQRLELNYFSFISGVQRDNPSHIVYHPSGDFLVVSSPSTLFIWKVEKQIEFELIGMFEHCSNSKPVFSQNGEYLLFNQDDILGMPENTFKVLQFQKPNRQVQVITETDSIVSVAISRDGTYVAIGYEYAYIHIWKQVKASDGFRYELIGFADRDGAIIQSNGKEYVVAV